MAEIDVNVRKTIDDATGAGVDTGVTSRRLGQHSSPWLIIIQSVYLPRSCSYLTLIDLNNTNWRNPKSFV